ncbi:peptide deformylase [Candidatus Vidania fulgoroideorum]
MKILIFPNKVLFLKNKLISYNLSLYFYLFYLKINILVNKGIGIALPQIGGNRLLFILLNKINKYNIFINSKILWKSNLYISFYEGCLSIKKFYKLIYRSKYIILLFYDVNNKKHKLFIKNKKSIYVQHEQDHLESFLILNKFNSSVVE